MRLIDLTGKQYGRLTAIHRTSRAGSTYWLWRCACGVEKEIRASGVTRGLVVSCGCHRNETAAARTRTHGETRTPTYESWRAARQRCYQKSNNRYQWYGGRGIKMCDRWRDDYSAFKYDMGERPVGMTLDRIDPDRDYSPDNCRWATSKDQAIGHWDGRRNRARLAPHADHQENQDQGGEPNTP